MMQRQRLGTRRQCESQNGEGMPGGGTCVSHAEYGFRRSACISPAGLSRFDCIVRLRRQDKPHVLEVLGRAWTAFVSEPLEQRIE
jgi:hypothetical protein